MILGNGPCHLTYCSNIHPGETWAEVRSNLEQHLPPVRARLAPDTRFGIGLRLSTGLILPLRKLLVRETCSVSECCGPLHRDAHISWPHSLQIGIAPGRPRRLVGFLRGLTGERGDCQGDECGKQQRLLHCDNLVPYVVSSFSRTTQST